jgi:hypothetical protein
MVAPILLKNDGPRCATAIGHRRPDSTSIRPAYLCALLSPCYPSAKIREIADGGGGRGHDLAIFSPAKAARADGVGQSGELRATPGEIAAQMISTDETIGAGKIALEPGRPVPPQRTATPDHRRENVPDRLIPAASRAVGRESPRRPDQAQRRRADRCRGGTERCRRASPRP